MPLGGLVHLSCATTANLLVSPDRSCTFFRQDSRRISLAYSTAGIKKVVSTLGGRLSLQGIFTSKEGPSCGWHNVCFPSRRHVHRGTHHAGANRVAKPCGKSLSGPAALLPHRAAGHE